MGYLIVIPQGFLSVRKLLLGGIDAVAVEHISAALGPHLVAK